ncbi:DNA (cytosine-5-)-methyltransferase [Ascochyta rabiei]|uniref:DNA (cytosine-5-)-methyltransferase n=1 Tax=Didymella rabiei TaxID=5454 RepID=UPI00190159F5|nr:DNA (cytosine-5-)-methyltransferase [Ascochyta rabiei]UPX15996.1 DNA (cytosine-5-)-methyltransferase [Ascochyta rabiei]
MAGRSIADAISLVEDEDEDENEAAYLADEVDVQGYDDVASEDDDEPDYVLIDDDDDLSSPVPAPMTHYPILKDFELPSLSLECGVIRPGSVVELQDRSGREANAMRSGDFLLVRAIIESVETEEVVIRGYRMRRCAYLWPLFAGQTNELFMLIHTDTNDDRPSFVQGLEEVDIEEIVGLRKCLFTNLHFDILGLQQANTGVPERLYKNLKSLHKELRPLSREMKAIKSWLLNKGTLICRWVHVIETYDRTSGTSYAGEVRRLYKREAADFSGSGNPVYSSTSDSKTPTPIPSPSKATSVQSPSSAHKRVRSLEIVDPPASKRCQRLPQKSTEYTMGDGFCGCGGATCGAMQAGLKVVWGLEKDEMAMRAYRKNFPAAIHLEMDAWDFPDIAKRCIHGVDLLHFSCPCQYWSDNHTVDGVNDQANMETIYIPYGWLLRLKPRLFSMEQAPGLIRKAKHRLHFRRLLNDFISLGYNVRYRVQNQAWLGLAQQRRRLVFVGAKIGQPLPPFPQPEHGPTSTGLKRFVTIEDALQPLMRVENRLANNKYHRKHREKSMNVPPIDPHISMANCITTNGGDNAHYSGQRAMTVMELAQLQGLGLQAQFAGSVTEAKRQCGNAWAPTSNKKYFLLWAATLEAFDNGLIEAEDDITDLYDFLEQKGIKIARPIIDLDGISALDGAVSAQPQYRYLSRLEKAVKPRVPLILWSRKADVPHRPPRVRRAAIISSAGLDGITDTRRSHTIDQASVTTDNSARR